MEYKITISDYTSNSFWITFASQISGMQKFFLYILFLVTFATSAFAQTTKVKGVVKDSSSGEPLPFVSIYFPGTTVGVTTDFEGFYTIETRQSVPNTIKAELMGYTSAEGGINIGGYTEMNFSLDPLSFSLEGVTVKADDKKVRAFMKRVCDRKPLNNPDEKESSQCKIYSKMELDMTNVDPITDIKFVKKNFGFITDYMDTSAVSGQPYLPVMISESSARYYKQKDPAISREVILASRISGIEEDLSLAQFTGHLHAKINLYDNYLDIFYIKFASPLSDHGFMYYNYYLIDSVHVDGRKYYKLRFHPKMASAPVLDGEFSIDSATMALSDAHIKMVKRLNVNWVRDLVIDVKNQLVNDSTWFNGQDKLYVDFSVTMRDSSKLVSFLGHREVNYSDVEINTPIPKEIAKLNTNVIVNKDVLQNDPQFWEKERPYALTAKEQGIYNMVDSIKKVPAFNTLYTIVSTIVDGYWNLGKFEIGPYYKLFSFNNLEGARFQFGGRTTADLSKKLRVGGYLAYGTKDQQLKGGGTVEYVFNNQPTRKITAMYKHDALQLGTSEDAFSEGNILGSILSKGNSERLTIVDKGSISYEHEWSDGFSTYLTAESNRISHNEYVQMFTPDSIHIGGVQTTAIGLGARISWNEMIDRGNFGKYYLGSDYPIIFLNFKMGLKDVLGGDYDFYRGEIAVNYDLALPPLGTSYFKIQAGKIWGDLPYPMLKLHEGNGTYFNSPGAFACMEFYEFASDTWFQWFYEHNFKGFFLGKIPLLKRLQWREVVSFRGVVGSITDENNGTSILFPAGMSGVNKPYIEAGVGITNIFRLFRVDSYWRLNHRHNHLGEEKTKWVINFGIELKF